MSSNEQDRVRELARRIAARIEDAREPESRDARKVGGDGEDGASSGANLAELNRRLARLEAQMNDGARDSSRDARDASGALNSREVESARPTPRREVSLESESAKTIVDRSAVHAPRLLGGGGTFFSAVHPSEQRFGIGEAVTELVDYFEGTKKCELEPGDKPCDHCGMCSSRGF